MPDDLNQSVYPDVNPVFENINSKNIDSLQMH